MPVQDIPSVLIDYSRRDGTPFCNLLICSPLYDDKGAVRYFISAQVDVTGLVEEGRGVESFRQLLQKDQQPLMETKRLSNYSAHHKDSWLRPKAKETLERLQN
jgi:hypothetical protein